MSAVYSISRNTAWLLCLIVFVPWVQELQEGAAAPECLAFAVTMLCMDVEFEGQAAALLRTAFDLIPARDFCLCEMWCTCCTPVACAICCLCLLRAA